jgi:hypothetical protein
MDMDIKHLPKLRAANGESRQRYLHIAIDCCSRWVHPAVKDDELTSSAVDFLKEAIGAFPVKAAHLLTERGSCLTADGFKEAGRKLKVEHRKPTVAWSASTIGSSARCWVSRSIAISDLETLLKGFNQAYNLRRQRVL